MKKTAIFTISNLLSFVLRIIAGLLVARLAGPEILGKFNSQGLLISYCVILLLGVQDGLARELPYLIGKDDKNLALNYASVAQSWLIIAGGTVALILLGISLYQFCTGNAQTGTGWLAFSFNGFVIFYSYNYLLVTYRTKGDFTKLAVADMISGVLLLISSLFVNFFGYFGLCLRLIVVDFSKSIFLWIWRPVKVRPAFDREIFFKLLKIGLPIYISSQVYVWWSVLNLSLILFLCGSTQLGVFQLAVITASSAEIVIGSITQVVYPKTTQEYGKNGDKKQVFRMLGKYSGFLFGIIAFIGAAAWLLIPVFTRTLLPDYVEGIQAAKIAGIATIPLCVQPLTRLFFIVNNRSFYLISVLIGILVYSIVLLNFRGAISLSVFPAALLVGRSVYAVLVLCLTYWLSRQEAAVEGKVRYA